MNTSKHTPGPWTLERDRAKSLSLYSGSTFIGEVYHEVDEPSTQEQANAYLIAAAPALYTLIKDMREAFYVKGTRKALLAVMERSHEIMAQAEGK